MHNLFYPFIVLSSSDAETVPEIGTEVNDKLSVPIIRLRMQCTASVTPYIRTVNIGDGTTESLTYFPDSHDLTE